jgi:hypothetical protein
MLIVESLNKDADKTFKMSLSLIGYSERIGGDEEGV